MDRSSLPERLAKVLEEEIGRGVWKERLPGYRVLAKVHAVSRPTCEEAFRILEHQGLLRPAESRQTRKIIAPTTGRNTLRRRHLLVISDRLNPTPPDDERLISKMTAFWQSKGWETSRVVGDLSRNKHPDSILRRWIRDTGAGCLLLYMPPKSWAVAAEQSGLPCYTLGGETGDDKKHIAGNGWAPHRFLPALLKAASAAGHQKILYPFAGSNGLPWISVGVEAAVAKLTKENPKMSIPKLSTAGPGTADPATWKAWWPKALALERPTLVVLGRVEESVGFNSHCLRNGIRVPEDISLLVMADDPVLEWLDPEPTRYRYPIDQAVRHFRSWVRRGFQVGDFRHFELELVKGKTFGPVAKSPA